MPTTSARQGRLERHVDFLARLHQVFAAFNAIVGLGVAAFAIAAALLTGPAGRTRPGAEIAATISAAGFLVVAATALLWAAVHWWCGRALRARDVRGRWLALALATMNGVLFPLGTMLAGYSLWVLLQEETRSLFEA